MKLFAFFATAIFAQDDAYAAPTDPPTVAPTTKAPEPVDIDIAWPGQTETNPCGSQISTNMENAVNKTCTISYPNAYKPFRKFLGGTNIILKMKINAHLTLPKWTNIWYNIGWLIFLCQKPKNEQN